MTEITVYCRANRDGRRRAGVSVDRSDYYEWEFGATPGWEDRDPRLEWAADLRVRSDRMVSDEAEVAYWFRCHRAALAEVLTEAAEQVPLGIASGIGGWQAEYDRPWGRVGLTVSASNTFHADTVPEYLREFAGAGLGAAGVRPLAIEDAVAPAEWLALRAGA